MRGVVGYLLAFAVSTGVCPLLTHALPRRIRGQEDSRLPSNVRTVRRGLDEGTSVGASGVSSGVTPTVVCSGSAPDITLKSDGRIYVERLDGSRGGCVTLTDIYQSLLAADGTNTGPLYILDADNNVLNGPGQQVTGRWILRSDLYVQSGVTLLVWGTDWGGDADVLRLDSNPSDYYNLRGYGGSLSFFHTKVTSWDLDAGAPRVYLGKGRSYISCVSEKLSDETCAQRAKKERGECRMDVISSEIAYLGYSSSESYGLTWKVRGLCNDLRNLNANLRLGVAYSIVDFLFGVLSAVGQWPKPLKLFDEVNVYGDIIDSDIHHNYFGMYSYGHEGGVWTNNLMHDNLEYGFDPHDDSDNLVIAYNTVYGNGNHGIIASKRCNNVSIHHNEVYNGQEVGIFLHRSSDQGKVYSNYVHDNMDAGMALHESFDADIYDNTFVGNAMGVRISVGGGRNAIHNNVLDSCTGWGFVTYRGSDSPWVSDGYPSENLFYDNTMRNTAIATRFKDSTGNELFDNVFENVEMFRFDDAANTLFKGNVFPGDSCLNADSSTFTAGSQLPDDCY